MTSLCLLNRIFQVKNFSMVNNKLIQKVYWSSKSRSSGSDDEKKTQNKVDETKRKSEDALNKLNNLLQSMIEEDATGTYKSKLDLAKPVKRKSEHKLKPESTKEPPEKQMTQAVKSVAEALGGDTKQTESELLMKLLSTSDTSSTNNLSEIVKGMKVDREDASLEGQSRAEQVRQILQETKTSETRPWLRTRKARPEIPTEKIDLFGSEPLGIFTDSKDLLSEGVQNKTWQKLYERDLKLAVTHPPSNYFQQMILWTEQGKVWKFPIDNEQDLEEEKKVYFAEHVFLEKHLEPWCPQKGPLRHFMELVCVGLSKNPYMTVDMKKEHIEWFRNYFEEKKQLLKEVGALQSGDFDKGSSLKQIE